MATLRIEYVPIQKFALGWFGFSHLQLVYEPDEIPLVPNPQDDWYILEGDSESTDHGAFLGVLGESGTLTMSTANLASGADLIAKIGTPNDRGSRTLTPNTASVSNAWMAMANYGAEIQLNDFPYLAYGAPYTPYPTFNSSSVVASLLWQVGIDVNLVMPYGVGVSPGTSTYLGTQHNDILTMPTSRFDTLAGGYGNDDLSGTNVWYRVDKLFGGADDDTFHWSTGFNILNGGDPALDREQDGYDRVDYQGAGTITINGRKGRVRGLSPDYIVTFTGSGDGGGTDWLYSIEALRYDTRSDTLIFGKGVNGIDENLIIEMGGQDTASGDTIDFKDAQNGIMMVADATDQVRINVLDGEGSSKSWWLSGAETIIGSAQADEIHLSEMMISADGGEGDDILDSRNVKPGTGASPLGFDVELTGGAGQDTLISGVGRTLAKGDADVDTFILGALSQDGHTTELVIDGATAEDHLFIPLSFFDGEISQSDNSLLMPILGGIGNWADFTLDTAGTFIFQTSEQSAGDDGTVGIIPFTGQILFFRDGADLLISIVPGRKASFEIDFEGNPSFTVTYADLDFTRQTYVRVLNFEPGMLGITFDELIEGTELVTDSHGFVYVPYANWDEVVTRITGGGNYTDTLLPNPIGELPPQTGNPATSGNHVQIDGSGGDDTINLTAATTTPAPIGAGTNTLVSTGAGNDTITTAASADTIIAGTGDDVIISGAGDDRIDGGIGADRMTGGIGDDTYLVDNAADLVIEFSAQGHDTVISGIDLTLANHVEDLTLTGTAVNGTGNSGRNTLVGNDANNILDGGAGNDTLYGGNGDDTLIGGSGSDAYVYRAGTGHKTIIDTGPVGDSDTLVLDGGILTTDIRAYRLTSSPNDLVLGFTFGGWVALVGQLNGEGIEEILFDDGTTWTRATIAALDAPLLAYPPPEAMDDSGIVIFGTAATIPRIAVLNNDRSFDGNLQVIAVNDVSAGTITLDANGDLVVSAPVGFTGELTFSYTILDGHGEISIAHATIWIAEAEAAPVNAAPVANADTTPTNFRNTSILITPASLLANDTDANGDTLTITSVGNPTHGTVSRHPDGTIVFTPDTDFVGTATFTYTVSDGLEGTATATVNVIIAAPPSLTLQGTDGNDPLTGAAGDDTLNGLGGQDTLHGGLGSDSMSGGDGNDIYYVDHAGDQVIETNAALATGGLDTVHASIDYILTANVERLELEGAATFGTGNALNNVLYGLNVQHAVALDGGDGDDTLYGSLTGANILTGGNGRDVFYAKGNNNTLTGGAGNDSYYAQSATDIIIETGTTAATNGYDTLYANYETATLAANVEQLILQGSATNGTGNSLDNTLSATTTHGVTLDGGAGNDLITGTSYADILTGGLGTDQLDLRKGGHDTIRYTTAGFGRDTVMGFDAYSLAGKDFIDVSGRGFTAASLGSAIFIGASGSDTLITIGTDQIRLTNVSANFITASNFKF